MSDQTMGICPVCGKEFPSEYVKGHIRKFCSRACKDKYYYEQEGRATLQESKETRARIDELERRLEVSEQWKADLKEDYDEMDRELRAIRLDVAKACEDMRLMFDRGVLGVNTRSPNYPMLAEHSGFLRLIDKYEDHRPAQVIEEEKAIREMRQRHSREQRQAQLQGVTLDEQIALNRRIALEWLQLHKRCRHFMAWREINFAQQDARERYGVELGDEDPAIKPHLDILRDGRPAFQ
ncbi:hypothetical protein [Bifidobacterium tibiigranuli]|jgi:DNA repair exonuclease SbcCD ATPase subunit|uniref:hypothetical protein n=1 Tax=Bifidobacterium tibiigranuli TaxID=2172043 RepID=UPI0026F22150|nr:hypothetical protein [Bifidobacterium tibiigranuli]MCI1713365.1 hypothetical protein [Bifidobacterium tibiigranuli]